MQLTDSTGRKVEVDDIEGEIGEGAYISGATYLDDDSDVPEKELEWITDAHQERLYEELYQQMVESAEAWADAQEDR